MAHTLIVPLEEARLIYAVCHLSFISGLISLINNTFHLGIFSWLGFVTGTLYWKYPINGWRRNLDIATVQVCLWHHLYNAYEKTCMEYYYSIMFLGIILYFTGYIAGAKYGTYCHLGVHLCANVANTMLYLNSY